MVDRVYADLRKDLCKTHPTRVYIQVSHFIGEWNHEMPDMPSLDHFGIVAFTHT